MSRDTQLYEETALEIKSGRRPKRVDRNKQRTNKHVFRLLDSFKDGVVAGFSNDRWNDLAATFRQVSSFLSTDEYAELGYIWRLAWTQEINPTVINNAVEHIKARLNQDDWYSY